MWEAVHPGLVLALAITAVMLDAAVIVRWLHFELRQRRYRSR